MAAVAEPAAADAEVERALAMACRAEGGEVWLCRAVLDMMLLGKAVGGYAAGAPIPTAHLEPVQHIEFTRPGLSGEGAVQKEGGSFSH